MALTSLTNVKSYLGITNTDDDTLLTACVNRATSILQSCTSRTLVETVFRERFDGNCANDLILPEYPITNIEYVSVGTNEAFSLINVNADAYRAAVKINKPIPSSGDSTVLDSPVMTLEVYGGANDGSTAITLSSYATLSLLETYINALGTGWTMDIGVSDYDDYDSIELLPLGNAECLHNYAYPKIPDEPLDGYKTYFDRGLLTLPEVSTTRQGIIVKWTAGYATTPDDLEQACISMAAYLFNSKGKDFSVKSERLGDYAYTLADNSSATISLPTDVEMIIKNYTKKSGYIC